MVVSPLENQPEKLTASLTDRGLEPQHIEKTSRFYSSESEVVAATVSQGSPEEEKKLLASPAEAGVGLLKDMKGEPGKQFGLCLEQNKN